MLFLKQSTSVTIQMGPFVDKTDGVALETGLAAALDNATTGIRLTKNGATQVDRNDATAPAHDGMGLYTVVLDATDTGTLGTLRIIFEEAATCLPVWEDFMIMPANSFDSMFGSDALDVSVIEWLGTAAATPTTAGVPEVDVTFVGGSAEDLPTATLLAAAQTDLDTLTDASGEPGQAAPPVSATDSAKIGYLYKSLRNKYTGTATLITLFNDDGTTAGQKWVVAEAAGTLTRDEAITGA